MIANLAHFYSGGLTIMEAENMSLARLNSYAARAYELNSAMKGNS